MHEWSIAKSILDTALAEAQKQGSRRVVAICLKLAQSDHLNAESITFCLEALAKGTIAEGARIEIQSIPLEVKCRGCGAVSQTQEYVFVCPECGSPSLEQLTEEQVLLESIKVD